MNISTLIKSTNDRLQETLPTLTIIGWFNEAQNKLASRVEAVFPSLVNKDGTQSPITEPVWDDRFHDLLVIYACARFRESDEAIGEAQYLDGLFYDKLTDAVAEMDIPLQYKNNDNTQQFKSTEGQVDFTITKDTFHDTYGKVQVFVNGTELTKFSDFSISGRTISLLTPCIENDLVSILWETPYTYNYPPQLFQGSW